MMLQNFNTDTSAILQGITMTSLALRPSGHREYLDRDFLLISVVEILQKLLYNTRPLGPFQPCQYYSTRSASSSHKISGSAVKAILTDFYCKILYSHLRKKLN
jgi:hypothetical protein